MGRVRSNVFDADWISYMVVEVFRVVEKAPRNRDAEGSSWTNVTA